jgi:hypothetical protein
MKWIIGTLIVGVSLLLGACEEGGKCTKKNISASGKNDSHNNGENCMNCHKSGGEGTGCFKAAGSVYNSTYSSTMSNVIVKLYTQPNGQGTLKYTINGDAKGNFYTTEDMTIDGLYPAITGPTGTQYMGSSITSGACNACHGSSTGKLWAQ